MSSKLKKIFVINPLSEDLSLDDPFYVKKVDIDFLRNLNLKDPKYIKKQLFKKAEYKSLSEDKFNWFCELTEKLFTLFSEATAIKLENIQKDFLYLMLSKDSKIRKVFEKDFENKELFLGELLLLLDRYRILGIGDCYQIPKGIMISTFLTIYYKESGNYILKIPNEMVPMFFDTDLESGYGF